MPNLSGLRILVVEDEPLVALLLEDIIEDLGGSVACSASDLPEAMKLTRSGAFDLGILDVNLRGEMSFPAAELLARRGVPVMLVSGYAPDCVPASLRHVPILQKPYSARDIGRAITSVLPFKPCQQPGSLEAGGLAG